MSVPVIALDGPGGVGKGTLSRMLARDLGWHLLDSGAIYRALALAAGEAGLLEGAAAGTAGPRLVRLAGELPLRFEEAGETTRVYLGGRPVDAALRTAETGRQASVLAALPAVREALLQRQRDFRQAPGLVADGRDMGTVVFPDAPLKVFLTASPGERARRRLNQLKEQGSDATLAAVEAEIAGRDRRDRERSAAPLEPAADARILDSSGQDVADTYRVLAGWAVSVFGEIFHRQ